jgi:two-component system, NarL family, response regulator DevR
MKTDKPPIRILIVDDHAVVRSGLRMLLGDEPQIEIVGEASTGGEGAEQAARLMPDVVLLDLRLPDIGGLEVCRRLKSQPTPSRVLILTSYGDDKLVLGALSAGADGYLLKDVGGDDLATAIRNVARGITVLNQGLAGPMVEVATKSAPASLEAQRVGRLSAQERRCLNLLAEGKPNKQIADLLGLSEGTVRNYLSTIFTKLEVSGRAEAAAYWARYGDAESAAV